MAKQNIEQLLFNRFETLENKLQTDQYSTETVKYRRIVSEMNLYYMSQTGINYYELWKEKKHKETLSLYGSNKK